MCPLGSVRGSVLIGYGEPKLGTKLETAATDKGIPTNRYGLTLLGNGPGLGVQI
jgi:hypothetical protein